MLLDVNDLVILLVVVKFQLVHIGVHGLQLVVHDLHNAVHRFEFFSFVLQLVLFLLSQECQISFSFDLIVSLLFLTFFLVLVALFYHFYLFGLIRELSFKVVHRLILLIFWILLIDVVLAPWFYSVIDLLKHIFEEFFI
jgi:hypothetical protein